jgi:beta-phosphoglucomutase-like phosphatase (HAD superfamily)
MSNESVARGKPDPEIYLKTFEQLGVRAEETLVVEDNEKGIKAATEAGANVMPVREPTDVTYDRIRNEIDLIEGNTP